MQFIAHNPLFQSAQTWVCRYGYSSACLVGLALAIRRIENEQQAGGKANRQVQIYSVGYALSCALEIGLEFKRFSHPGLASLISNVAYFGGASVRMDIESQEKNRLGQVTCLMDMANAVVYVGIGKNYLSAALTVASPILSNAPLVWQACL